MITGGVEPPTFSLSGECPGPRESTGGRMSRPHDLLGHLGVQDRPRVFTIVVSTTLAVVLCIRRSLTSCFWGGEQNRIVHEICEEIRAPAVASAVQPGPDCCTAVIYLHTAVHKLWLTSQALTGVCASASCVHRRTDARLAPAGSRGTKTATPRLEQSPAVPWTGMRGRPPHAAGLPVLPQNLRSRKQHSGPGPGPARSRPACRVMQ